MKEYTQEQAIIIAKDISKEWGITGFSIYTKKEVNSYSHIEDEEIIATYRLAIQSKNIEVEHNTISFNADSLAECLAEYRGYVKAVS